MGGTQVFVSDELTTGLVTQPYWEASPPFLMVENLGWESGFRGSGLLPGDRIVAIDGVPLVRPPNGAMRSAPTTVAKAAARAAQEIAQQAAAAGR
jgi:hypothetical protein